MTILNRIFIVLLTALLVGGCANSSIKPVEVICPLVGAVAGTAIAAGATSGSDSDEAAMAIGAVVGAAIGHFACKESPPPPRATAPKPTEPVEKST